MTRDIVFGIEIHAEPKAVFDTVATRSGLAAFWTPDVEGDEAEGGELSFGFAEAPTRLPIRVIRSKAPSDIEWECSGDWPFWDGTGVSWSLVSSEHGTNVVFRHLRFSDDMPEYDFGTVAMAWAKIVGRLKDVVEAGGVTNPALG